MTRHDRRAAAKLRYHVVFHELRPDGSRVQLPDDFECYHATEQAADEFMALTQCLAFDNGVYIEAALYDWGDLMHEHAVPAVRRSAALARHQSSPVPELEPTRSEDLHDAGAE
jgi:hypothetical protein